MISSSEGEMNVMRAMLLTAAVGVALAACPAHAATRPVVLELFTSEGCSSCPPADALLNSLAGRADLLPLAFHVTYWNSLGWRDPYSMEAATSRQTLYAARLGGGTFTPEMVVDGQRGMVGSENDQVADAIRAARSAAETALPVRLSRSGRALAVAIGAGEGHGRILLVGFDPHHETQVGRGENSGRTLNESNIVRSMRTVGQYTGAAAQISVPQGEGADAAVIVQASDGRILGAARL